jgi:hypothetical protein
MATSGTTVFNPDQVNLIEEACAMAGFEARTGFDFRSARFALNTLLMEWANRGINLWTLTSTSETLVAGTATYTLPDDCVDVFDVVIRTNASNVVTQQDLKITRISMATYATIPNKLSTGRPLQYVVDRQIAPTITLWPVPDTTTTWTMFYYYLRRLEDAGPTANLTMDVPFRFYPALVAGLAYYMSMRKPELLERVPFMKAYYDEQLTMATDEDREKAAVRLVPAIRRV